MRLHNLQQDNVHGVCPMHFDSLQYMISELLRPVEIKIKQFNFKLYSNNDPFILLYYFNLTINISVTRPFDSSPTLYYKRSIVTMRLSGTVTETWRLTNNGVTSLIFWGHVTSSVT